MRTERFTEIDGTEGSATHAYSHKMVALAMKELLDFMEDDVKYRPGELEDHFTGCFSLTLEYWRCTPFFPALANLVVELRVIYGRDEDGVWYSKV